MISNRILDVIKESKRIAVLPHVFADGDALGSCLAMAIALKRMKKDAVVYLDEEIPFIYSFLPGAKDAVLFNGKLEDWDLALVLDTGDLERLGSRTEIFHKAKLTVNIDHHHTNSEFAFHNHIGFNASATGEIVHEFLKQMGSPLDKDMATCLYVAIATDTGGFRYSNTTAATHQITAELLGQGINVSEISQKVFDAVSVAKVKLMGAAIQNMTLYENGKIGFLFLSDEMLKSAGAKEEDCDGIVNLVRNIYSVEAAVLMRVRENGEIKVNLRSKNYVDVSMIAGMYGGGGHKRAAGCRIQGNVDEIREKLLTDIKEVI